MRNRAGEIRCTGNDDPTEQMTCSYAVTFGLQILQGLLTPVIAIVALYIAWQQYKAGGPFKPSFGLSGEVSRRLKQGVARRLISKCSFWRKGYGGLAHPFVLVLRPRVPCPCLSAFWRDRAGVSIRNER
jgi:hypothetical protein